MRNETGKEIYKEYVNRWIDAHHDDDSRENINEEYLWCEEPIEEGELFNGLNVSGKGGVLVVRNHYDEFTRAPKTQIINGHEVVAPRYDEPQNDKLIYWFDLAYTDGVTHEKPRHIDPIKLRQIMKYGWFESHDDCLEYANAHRESK